MKNATKKWLIVAGGLAACAALVFIIAGQFEKKPVNDTLPPPSCSSQGGVMVDEPDSSISPEKDDPEITVKPETPDTSSTPETGTAAAGPWPRAPSRRSRGIQKNRNMMMRH